MKQALSLEERRVVLMDLPGLLLLLLLLLLLCCSPGS